MKPETQPWMKDVMLQFDELGCLAARIELLAETYPEAHANLPEIHDAGRTMLRGLAKLREGMLAIIAAHAPQQWIPVSERLPEDGQSALINVPEWEDLYLRNRVAWIDFDTSPPQWVCNGETVAGVTHWMPLPAPPVPDTPNKESK